MYIKPLKGKDASKFWDAFYKSGIRKEALEKVFESINNGFLEQQGKTINKNVKNK